MYIIYIDYPRVVTGGSLRSKAIRLLSFRDTEICDLDMNGDLIGFDMIAKY